MKRITFLFLISFMTLPDNILAVSCPALDKAQAKALMTTKRYEGWQLSPNTQIDSDGLIVHKVKLSSQNVNGQPNSAGNCRYDAVLSRFNGAKHSVFIILKRAIIN